MFNKPSQHQLLIFTAFAALTLICGCAYPPYDGNPDDLEEQQSVWQYLKVYSIFHDRLPKAPGSMTPYDMFIAINDSLGRGRYTEYLDDRPGGGVMFDPNTEFDDPLELTPSTVYFAIPEFSDTALWVFQRSIRTLSRYQNIIIDVRDNGGGLLSVTNAILNELLPFGTPYIKNRYREYNSRKYVGETLESVSRTTKQRPELSNKNIVVLMNGGSASASEILAAGLKDGANAYLIGDQSYGKGIGQVIITRDKRKRLIITFLEISGITERTGYYHRIGIEPDPVPDSIASYVNAHVPDAEAKKNIQNDAILLHIYYLLEYKQDIPVSTIEAWLIKDLRDEYYALMLLEPDLRFIEEDEDTESDSSDTIDEVAAGMGKRRCATADGNELSAKKLRDIAVSVNKAKARWRPMGAVVIDENDLPKVNLSGY